MDVLGCGVTHLWRASSPGTGRGCGSRGVCPARSSVALLAARKPVVSEEKAVGAVVVGMDPHKRSATIEILASDGVPHLVDGSCRVDDDVVSGLGSDRYSTLSSSSSSPRPVIRRRASVTGTSSHTTTSGGRSAPNAVSQCWFARFWAEPVDRVVAEGEPVGHPQPVGVDGRQAGSATVPDPLATIGSMTTAARLAADRAKVSRSPATHSSWSASCPGTAGADWAP